MLWTDSQFIDEAFLATVDSDVSRVATDESLTLDGAEGLIFQSLAESGQALLRAGRSFGRNGLSYGYGGLTAGHLAEVFGVEPGAGWQFDLSQVVVHDAFSPSTPSTLKLWAAYRALERVYTAAINRVVNDDRYADKVLLQRAEVAKHWKTIRVNGVPIVLSPVHAPGATFAPNPGTFQVSDVTQQASAGSFAAQPYYVAVTYTGHVLTASKDNDESAGSAQVSITANANDALTVSIANLNQISPTVSAGLSRGAIPWVEPVGWNIYLGTSAATLYRQNADPIPIATKSHQLTAPVLSGAVLGKGQNPDANVELHDYLRIG